MPRTIAKWPYRENIGPMGNRTWPSHQVSHADDGRRPHTVRSQWAKPTTYQKLQAVLSSECRLSHQGQRSVELPLHQPSGPPSQVVVANMTTEAQPRPEGINTKSTRTLLRVIILLFIAGAAISSRLFSVIRKSRPHAHLEERLFWRHDLSTEVNDPNA